MRPIKSILPWVWAWGVAVCVFVAVAVEVVTQRTSLIEALSGVAIVLLFTFLGALIVVRQPGNAIGWLLMLIGLGIFLAALTYPLIESEPESASILHHSALVLNNWLISLVLYPLVLITYLFPTGSFFSRRQAWVGWLGAVMVPVNLLVAVFVVKIGPSFQDADTAWAIANPVGFLPSVALDAVLSLWGLSIVPLTLGGIWSLINRYRRSSEVVKAQIRWMLLSSLFLAIGFVLIITTDTTSTISSIITTFAFASIPMAITIAITRFRLFEIDRIISRTLTYTFVVAVLGAVYVGTVTLVSSLVASQNELAVAVSTLAVAALFNPLRKRLQKTIDRRFNRAGYEPEVVSNQLATRLQGSVRAEEIVQAWSDTVADSLQPESVAIWVNHTHTTPTDPTRP